MKTREISFHDATGAQNLSRNSQYLDFRGRLLTIRYIGPLDRPILSQEKNKSPRCLQVSAVEHQGSPAQGQARAYATSAVSAT